MKASELLPLSWSRIDTFLRCPRKFYYRYAMHLEDEPTDAMKIGSAVHEALEVYIKSGDELQAKASLLELPSQNYTIALKRLRMGINMLEGLNPVAVELKFGFDTQWNVIDFDDPSCFFRGIIDLVTKDQYGVQVWDYKTGWSKPDPRQVLTYALPLIKREKNVTSAGFMLLANGGTYVYPIDNEEIDSVFKLIFDIWKEIQKRFDEAEKERIPAIEKFQPDLTACSYCSFRQRCSVSGAQTIEEEVRNAVLARENANEIMAAAREYVKETGQPLRITDETFLMPVETLRCDVKGSGLIRDQNIAAVADWLAKNGGSEFINISRDMPPGMTEKMPHEIREMLQFKPTCSIKTVSISEIKEKVEV